MEKYITQQDIKVCYDVYNKTSKTTVVLIHGFGLNKDMWKPQITALKKYRVINIDARGHGKSRPCDKFNVIDVCRDIAAILEKESCKNAAVIGLSMGSYVAQEFVRLYPELTAGVMAADGTPLFIKYPRWETASLKWSGPLLRLYTWKSLKKLMAKQTAIKDDVRIKLVEMFDTQTKEEFINSWAGIANVLHEENVDIKCPFYVVYGAQDKSGTIKLHANDWEKEYPDCKVFEIPDAGHVSNMDNPKAFNKIMLKFLREVEETN